MTNRQRTTVEFLVAVWEKLHGRQLLAEQMVALLEHTAEHAPKMRKRIVAILADPELVDFLLGMEDERLFPLAPEPGAN